MYTRNEKIVPIYIEEEMKDSYISYAMSVIVGRALPDARDGLKPVHRRILYAMKELNLEHNKPYKKCARITGDTLGRYHPHGDVAVYDALVRMAQDFSLRYPLVDGQGNFGCFTKDTKIRLSDGRCLNFEELIKETRQGKKNYTFTLNPETQKIEIAEIKNPRKTQNNAKIIKIILDNNAEIKCTPDHPFMLRDGTYRAAEDLRPQDSLMPLYAELFDGKKDPNLKGYEVIYQPLKNTWEFIHHIADKWNLSHKIYKKSTGKIRHHKDFNKLNNNPDNIQRIQWNQHWKLHKEIASLRHKNDPEYVKKLAEGRKRFFADPNNLQKISNRLKARNQKNWQDPDYRQKMRKAIQRAWQRPEYRKIIMEASSKNLKNLWKKEEFKQLLSRIKSKELRKRWQDPEYRKFISRITRETSLKIWSDSQHKINMSRLSKTRWQDADYRKRVVDGLKKLWKDPLFRSKYSPAHFKKAAKKLWEDPKIRELHKEKAHRQWQNLEFRANIINGIINANRQRLQENPNLMQELTKMAATSLKLKWQDPLYKRKVIRSKILGFVGSLLKKNEAVTKQLYDKERISGLPKLETALQYFSDFEDLVYQAKQKYNHKVIRVETIEEKQDVYDLTIEPWHNFALADGVFVHNSVDGDSPAAMRYTEARLAHITDLMLQDIEKDTVKFVPNFDETMEEPTILPAVLPNLLVNGSSGIAVGMATNIPPHNLNEVCDAVAALIEKPEIEIKELMKYIKGPDFPTGGIIRGKEGIKSAYTMGRGLLKVHAKAGIEEQKSGKEAIVITELPYQVNKANLIESIADLVRDKKIEGISDVRDESDKEGIRVVIELKRGENAQVILNNLYKHTQMQETFGIIMLALVNGKPQVLNLKQLLENYIEHRKDIIIRRTKFDLNKAQERAHILEGLKIALDNLDKIIKTIRQSKDPQTAKEALIKNFGLSEKQAVAILEMQLQRLTALEREKIDEEYLDLIKKIALYKSILESEKKVLEIIKTDASALKEKFGDERRTEILSEIEELAVEDLIAEEDVVITISHTNYIKRLPVSAYRKQKRGGKGVTGADMKEEDFIEHLFIASTHDFILFFTNKGRVHWLKVHEIPQASRQSRGKAIINMIALEQGEAVSAYIPVREFKEGSFLVMATKNGLIKKTDITAFANPRKAGIIALTLEKDDELIGVELTDGHKELILATKEGKAIRFPEEHVRDMGRGAKGVFGIRLAKKDVLIAVRVVEKDATLLTVTENGFGKRTDFSEYRVQSRGGKGIINIKANKKNGLVVGVKSVTDKDELMLMTEKGMIVRCAIKDIRATGRSTQGVRLMKLEDKDKVASIARVIPEEGEEGDISSKEG